jgi:hypothetical protein
MIDFYGRKRKFRLKLILTMKKSDFNVNEFLLIENVYLRCFFSLKLALNNKFELKKSCSFRVHYIAELIFELLEATCFTRCLDWLIRTEAYLVFILDVLFPLILNCLFE